MSEPRPVEVEIATEKLKSCTSLGTDQILAKLLTQEVKQ
jgi:hypothetical protein